MPRRRPRFSLFFLFLVTGYAAALLNLQLQVYGRQAGPRELATLLLFAPLLCAICYWLITSASWGCRIFLGGLIFGAVVDFGSLCLWHANEWVAYTSGVWLPEGWFPAAFPVERALTHFGLCRFHNAASRSIAGGMLITGLACGIFAWLLANLASANCRAQKPT